ncbi:sensor histidine kinase [Parafilimonas sp.]|uniref:sensor histidine kinase n=1 Tax=Parafilimonas sp. TaxID=1969739 RepID=UPI0039E6B70C
MTHNKMDRLVFIQRKKAKIVLLNIVAWFIYASFIFSVTLLTKPNVTIISTLLYLLPLCITFYISIYCLNFYKEKGVWWSIASFFIVFIVMATIGYGYIYFLLPSVGIVVYTSTDFKSFIQEALLSYVRYFSFALLYFYVMQSFKKEQALHLLQQEKSKKELENAILKQQELKAQQEKLQFEHAFLRSQINPHFLHNTLNTLFSEALNYSPELADNILKLSHIMRYSLESLEFESWKVSVQKELEHLQTLIDINNLRFGKSKNITYSVEGELNGQMVPPFSFITIVENAYKYGDLKGPENPLTITVILKPGEVYFYCRNKIKKSSMQFSSSNIGISNLSKRLDVAFKDKYDMKANRENDSYIFQLTVKS